MGGKEPLDSGRRSQERIFPIVSDTSPSASLITQGREDERDAMESQREKQDDHNGLSVYGSTPYTTHEEAEWRCGLHRNRTLSRAQGSSEGSVEDKENDLNCCNFHNTERHLVRDYGDTEDLSDDGRACKPPHSCSSYHGGPHRHYTEALHHGDGVRVESGATNSDGVHTPHHHHHRNLISPLHGEKSTSPSIPLTETHVDSSLSSSIVHFKCLHHSACGKTHPQIPVLQSQGGAEALHATSLLTPAEPSQAHSTVRQQGEEGRGFWRRVVCFCRVRRMCGERWERRSLRFIFKRSNICALLWFTAFSTLFYATAFGQIFDAYLFLLAHESNLWVGETESVSGVTSLIAAIPVGIAVDRYNRRYVCWVAGVLALFATILCSAGCWRDHIPLLLISLVLWGFVWELSASASFAIFTDSMPPSDRPYWFTVKGVISKFAEATGPLLLALYFFLEGDQWTMPLLHAAIITGALVCGPGWSLSLFLVRNPEEEKEEEEEQMNKKLRKEERDGLGMGEEGASLQNDSKEGDEEESGPSSSCWWQRPSLVEDMHEERGDRRRIERTREEERVSERNFSRLIEDQRNDENREEENEKRSKRTEVQDEPECGRRRRLVCHGEVIVREKEEEREKETESLLQDRHYHECSKEGEDHTHSRRGVPRRKVLPRHQISSISTNIKKRTEDDEDDLGHQKQCGRPSAPLLDDSSSSSSFSSSPSSYSSSSCSSSLSPSSLPLFSSPSSQCVNSMHEEDAPLLHLQGKGREFSLAYQSEKVCDGQHSVDLEDKKKEIKEEEEEEVKRNEEIHLCCKTESLHPPMSRETSLKISVGSRPYAPQRPIDVVSSSSSSSTARDSCCRVSEEGSLLSTEISKPKCDVHGPCKRSLLASTLAEEELCYFSTALEIAKKSIESRGLSSEPTLEKHLGKISSTETGDEEKQEEVRNLHIDISPSHRISPVERHAPETSLAGSVPDHDEEWLQLLSIPEKSIPFLVAASDIVRAFGAGMTVKFFPLFFKEDYGFQPVDLCFLGAVYAVSIGLFMLIGERLGHALGRASAACAYHIGGLAMLFSMCVVQRLPLMVVVFLLRGAMQNAVNPLTRSIIMDFTKKANRGKWNAVESFSSTLWSGSALLGGLLADKDYRYAFFVTAIVYAFALIIFLPVVWLVPGAERKMPQRSHQRVSDDESSSPSCCLPTCSSSTCLCSRLEPPGARACLPTIVVSPPSPSYPRAREEESSAVSYLLGTRDGCGYAGQKDRTVPLGGEPLLAKREG
ncbi:major facilitator family transporter [Cystoisospora suis]|uniref:Major facilitator family transporter n=1 Tax=Cystoisospora suis TaxID=483139 RepID=A0A2C6L1G0_9APIC|nr:major facilitator family transporter [Cystoisospora suis]